MFQSRSLVRNLTTFYNFKITLFSGDISIESDLAVAKQESLVYSTVEKCWFSCDFYISKIPSTVSLAFSSNSNASKASHSSKIANASSADPCIQKNTTLFLRWPLPQLHSDLHHSDTLNTIDNQVSLKLFKHGYYVELIRPNEYTRQKMHQILSIRRNYLYKLSYRIT
jgi:hypothetical protein